MRIQIITPLTSRGVLLTHGAVVEGQEADDIVLAHPRSFVRLSDVAPASPPSAVAAAAVPSPHVA